MWAVSHSVCSSVTSRQCISTCPSPGGKVGADFSARIKPAYSVPTKTKRLSYRGLEKGVTPEEGVGS